MRFTRNLSAATAVAGLALLAHADMTPTPNSQIRLAYFGDSAMMVSWNTYQHVDQPTVHWGRTADNLNETASSNVSVTYATSLTYNNHVLVSGLRPDTTYFYLPTPLVGADNSSSSRAPFNFTTSRAVGDTTPFSIAVVVDLGTMGSHGLTTHAGKGVDATNVLGPNDTNTIQSLAAQGDGIDFVWHPGDLAYADYWLKESIQGFLANVTLADGVRMYETILNEFYDEMAAAVTAHKPYMVGPGNHEANCDNGGTTDKAKNITYTSDLCVAGQTNFTGYKNHFRMPSALSGGTGNFWYSFDSGMVHFVQLDTETDLGHGLVAPDEVGGVEGMGADPVNATLDAQTAWLAADLAAVDRARTPWVVVAGHRPWYLSHKNQSGTICWSCKDVFEPLLLQYDVDLVLSGHAHVYERQAPLAAGVADPAELDNPAAPWYITNGAAGHYDGLDALQTPRQPYSRFGLDTSNATFGWSRLTFHNCSHLTHEFVASRNGSVLDTATLYKARTCSAATAAGNGTNGTTGGGGVPTTKTSGATAAAGVPALATLALFGTLFAVLVSGPLL